MPTLVALIRWNGSLPTTTTVDEDCKRKGGVETCFRLRSKQCPLVFHTVEHLKIIPSYLYGFIIFRASVKATWRSGIFHNHRSRRVLRAFYFYVRDGGGVTRLLGSSACGGTRRLQGGGDEDGWDCESLPAGHHPCQKWQITTRGNWTDVPRIPSYEGMTDCIPQSDTRPICQSWTHWRINMHYIWDVYWMHTQGIQLPKNPYILTITRLSHRQAQHIYYMYMTKPYTRV